MINKRTGKVAVLGFGTSGAAATRLLLEQGWDVTVIDERSDLTDSFQSHDVNPAAVHVARDVSSVSSAAVDAAIVSPGIAGTHSWLTALRAEGIDIIPEFELGLSFLTESQVIAVTGSNGKSSLVKWLADALNENGRRAVPAGNYGVPVCDVARSTAPPDIIVLELSSFQLEQSTTFRPAVGVLLNLSPNHLDRHESYAAYAQAKLKIFANMNPGDLALIHAPAVPQAEPVITEGCTVQQFGEGEGLDAAYIDGWVHLDGEPFTQLEGTWWGMKPQSVNAAAGAAVLHRLGLGPEAIRTSAEVFKPLPHRFESFCTFNGVEFIDDSKASTLSAMGAAVVSGGTRKHLIAGGILKESDVTFVKELLVENCAIVYCIGRVAEKLFGAWKDHVPCEKCGDLETAVARAFANAKPGEVVLLSPGCSSFDQFSSYAQRGQKFKELVRACISRNRGDEKIMQGVRI